MGWKAFTFSVLMKAQHSEESRTIGEHAACEASCRGSTSHFPFMQNKLLSLFLILHKHPFVFSNSLARFFPPLTTLLRVLPFSQEPGSNPITLEARVMVQWL